MFYFTLIVSSVSLKFSQAQTTQTDSGNLFPLIQGKRLSTGPDVSLVISTFQSSQGLCFSHCSADGTCRCASFKKSSGACSLFADDSWEIGFTVVDDADSVIFQKLADTVKYGEWTLAFRGLAGINKTIYDAYTDIAIRHDQPMTLSSPLGCVHLDTALPCEVHFHSNILNTWNSLKIYQVMFTFYVDGLLKRFIVFNGTSTTIYDWFKPAGVLNSSWVDLTTTQTYNYFSFHGLLDPTFNRRFFIESMFNTCAGDTGWVGVVDKVSEQCPWATRTPSFPRFFYSPNNTKVYNADMLYADVLAVFVKY